MDKNTSVSELLKAYKTWVCRNPNTVTDLETVVTWTSYYFAGKINKSPVVSELVYSLSKLLCFYNDRVIQEEYGNEVHQSALQNKIKILLTVIHYAEVFMELLVRHRFGTKGKWSITTVLQIIKCSSNLMLLYKYRETPILHPQIPVLQRRNLTARKDDENANMSFQLKRSGRIIRRVDGAPPISLRDWQPLSDVNENQHPNINVTNLIYAETIHVLKPIIHLASMGLLGQSKWNQWFISLGLDLASLKLYSEYVKELPYEQRLELSRRKLSLLLYLIRSPMYNKYSKNIIERLLASTSNTIPMASFVCNPVLQYLNHWQDTYFYMWSS